MKNQAIELVVTEDERAVDVWRKRFTEALERYDDLSLTELSAVLAKTDSFFDGIAGYRRIENVKRGIAGEKVTRRATLLMEQLRPAKPSKSSRLSRQKLTKA